jgi:hypothetical protein
LDKPVSPALSNAQLSKLLFLGFSNYLKIRCLQSQQASISPSPSSCRMKGSDQPQPARTGPYLDAPVANPSGRVRNIFMMPTAVMSILLIQKSLYNYAAFSV